MTEAAPKLTNNEAAAVIKAVDSSAVAVALPPAETFMGGWIPPRQVMAAGIFFLVAWFILHAIAAVTGIDVSGLSASIGVDPLAVLAGGIAALVSAVVPPSWSDRIKWLNDAVVHFAQRDPESNVSYVLPPVAPPPGSPPVIR